jgi:hypothetical protein
MRIARTIPLIALAALAGATPLPSQGTITYAPGARRYHLISVVKRTQEMEGQKTEYQITNEQRVSLIIVAHTRDTLRFAVTLDSSRLSSNLPVQLPDLSKLQGTRVSGAMSPSGKVYTVASSVVADSGTDAQSLVEGMSRFLIPVPRGVRIGSSWVDTATSTVKREGNDLESKTITTTTLLGDTTFAGEKAWRLERKLVLQIGGTQVQGSDQLAVKGDGTGSGMYYVSTKGVYLGSTATQNMTMTVAIASKGLTIPVTQSAISKVELVK